MHYTETNDNPANLELRAQLKKMFGNKAVPDIVDPETHLHHALPC
jgi:hypothetical protein